MGTLDKLVKALEALKISKDPPSAVEDEAAVRRKKKVELCSFVAESMCSPSVKGAPNFASLLTFSMETLLQLCDDPDSNIRMVADESLNRIIRAMMDNNIVKVHVELHKEIKKNGNVRSLRAALWRFAQLAHMIRPQKGKAYIQNLVPSLVEIAKRREEPVLETLATSIPYILAALGSFTTDNNIRELLKSFLANLSSDATVVRRTAASSIVSVCLHSRKPSVFLSYTLNSLLEKIVPVKQGDEVVVQGVLNCVRLLLPHLTQADASDLDGGLQGSFGVRSDTQDSYFSVDRFIQIYELCLHFTSHPDHNMVTTALETLHQLLSSAPKQLLDALLMPKGIARSHIHSLPSDNEKISHRSLSAMSVVSSVDHQTADSPLLDTQDEMIQEGRLIQWIHSSTSSQIDSASEESDTEGVTGGGEVLPILVGQAIERAPSLEADMLLARDSPSPEAIDTQDHSSTSAQVWAVGSMFDDGCPALLHCCRCLVTRFLLPEGTPGPRVRVSVKALALQCLTQLVRLYPALFFSSIDVNNQATPNGFSHVSDVLCYSSHSDQQLRGLCCIFVGTLIRSALVTSTSTFHLWADTCQPSKQVTLSHLVSLLINGLEDESSTCVRHALTGLSTSLSSLLASCDLHSVTPVLPALLRVTSNSYWLVKVKLLELLGDLSYLHVYYLTGSSDFQSQVLHSVILVLLGDEDVRVRRAVCEAVTRLCVNMFHSVDERNLDVVNCAAVRLRDDYLSGLLDRDCEKVVNRSVESTLSRVVHLLTRLLLQSSSKHLTAGCSEALCSLSLKFPPTTYSRAWHCSLEQPPPPDTKTPPSATGLLGIVVAMLTASPLSLDLDIHNSLLVLAAHIYTGLAATGLKEKDFTEKVENKPMWSQFSDPKMCCLSETLLHHLVRMMCVFVRVLEDTPGPKNPTPSPIKRRPARPSSPAKLTPSTGDKEGGKEEKGKFGHFIHIPHYNKLFDNLRSAYTNYKTQLECGDKVAGLLGSVLLCVGNVLEFSTLSETGRLAEELLQYLRVVVSLEPTASVSTVQQLLKSLFGSNHVAAWEEERERAKVPPPDPQPPPLQSPSHSSSSPPTPGFYELILGTFQSQIYSSPSEMDILPNKLVKERWNHRKAVSVIKGLMKGSDRHALASYIRLFEPMVIQALKQYTVTNNVRLQVAVLSLLTQLVQLRVNYCLLDSDQIFIEFVLKQFEFLEAGQINQAEVLIPKMFEFLVHLSYEKNHSKPVIGVAKVIQLCDGLMASGQDPLTHCIPALSPIVEHVFTATSSVSAWQVKTQRDVVISMLLRLVEYSEVLTLLSRILVSERSGEESKRWSHQTADVLMPLLAQGRVRLDSAEAIAALLTLLSSFLPRTLSPPDPVLRVLFTSQLYEVEYSSRSLSTMLAMLIYIIGRDEEDSLLARLEDLKLCVREQSDDPLNATAANLNDPPQTVFARHQLFPQFTITHLCRLLFRTLLCLTSQLHSAMFSCHSSQSSASYLQYLLAHFILCCCHLLKSSRHQVIAAGLVSLMTQTESASVSQLNQLFINLAPRCPLVVVLWCRLVAALGIGHSDKAFWSSVVSGVSSTKGTCLNLEIVQRGSLIVFCELIASSAQLMEESAWLIGRHFPSLLALHSEPPVSDLLEACKNNPATTGLLLPSVEAVATNNPPPRLVSRILDWLFSVSLDDSGPVLSILSSLLQYPHLVLARRAATLASSRVEYLLILERDEVVKMLNHEDLSNLLRLITTKNSRLASKHSGFVSLLKKLASTHYDISIQCEQSRNIVTTNIRSICLDKAWYLTQVRLRCCQVESAQQCSQLLSQLDYEDIVSVMRCQQFNNCILQHCFVLGAQLTMQARKTRREGEHLSSLLLAARTTLLQHIHHLHTLLPRVHQIFCPEGRTAFPKESKYTARLTELFGDSKFLDTLVRLVPAVVSYLAAARTTGCDTAGAAQDLAVFGVLCTEVVHWVLGQATQTPNLVNSCLECAVDILRPEKVTRLLSTTQLGSICSTLARLVHYTTGSSLTLPWNSGYSQCELMIRIEDGNNLSLPKLHKGNDSEEPEDSPEVEAVVMSHMCYQVAALVSWVEVPLPPLANVPSFLIDSIRAMVQSVSRCGPVLWYSVTPPDAWPPSLQPIPVSSPVPPPPLHDIDLLRQHIFRISLVGWTSRTQFEETWMSLLTVLSASPGPESEHDEVQAMMQGSSVAVQAITSLLVQTLLEPSAGNPSTGHLLHSSRNRPLKLPSLWGDKLETVTDALYWKLRECQRLVPTSVKVSRLGQQCNVERLHCAHRYGYGQVSIDFLKTAVMSAEERAGSSSVNCDYVEHQRRIEESGLDLHSCLQFLLDLYSQWTQPEVSIPLNLLLEVVRSTVILSDLFSERSHWAWMLDLGLELSRTHPVEDEILHHYLLVAVCKSAAVLPALETEASDRVLRLLEAGLKASFTPTKKAAVYGLLYLLESFIHLKVEEMVGESPSKTPDTRQRVLSMAKEFISKNFTGQSSSLHSEESQLVLYSLVLYVMEHSPQELTSEVQSHLLQLVISTSSGRQIVLYQALVEGVSRLVLCQVPGVLEPATRLAVDRLNQSDPTVSLPALRLLLICMYAGEYSKMRSEGDIVDPEQLVATMEKTSALFERVKKGSPLEVECVCAILPFLLADFFPASEVLTKVIGEFLSPQQPNHRHLSAVVFQVLSQACREDQLPLLQAWLVMSLHIFTQTLPVATATWCLSCFFISASTNPWLRAIFPHVQSRMGKCTYEDRKLLCIAASDFYRQLTDEKLKETFLKTFKEAALTPRSPFADMIASL